MGQSHCVVHQCRFLRQCVAEVAGSDISITKSEIKNTMINFNLIQTTTNTDGILQLKLHNNADSGKIYKTMSKKIRNPEITSTSYLFVNASCLLYTVHF